MVKYYSVSKKKDFDLKYSNNDLIEEVSKTEEGGWSETSMQLTVA